MGDDPSWPDQADTLRRLMGSRQDEVQGQLHLPRVSAKIPMFLFTALRERLGMSTLCQNLALIFAREGDGTLLCVGSDKEKNARCQIIPRDKNLWINTNVWNVPTRSDAFPPDVNMILMDLGGTSQIMSSRFDPILVVPPEESSVTQAASLLRWWHADCGISRVGLVVSPVTEGPKGSELGRNLFVQIQNRVCQYFDARIRFLGHVVFNKQGTPNSKYLIDLYPSSVSARMMELIAKNMRIWREERLQEETAPLLAPWN